MLVLSLFPGIGLLDHAFSLEGYCTVRGPDPIWGGDIHTFHPPAGVFGLVIGGPPCQSFSSLVHLVRANGHEPTFGNLIPEFERCVREAQPVAFLMENVPQAPEPSIDGYGMTPFLLDNSALDSGDGFGHEQRRVRKFCFGQRGVARPPDLRRWIDLATFLLPDAIGTATIWSPNNSAEAKGRVRSRTVTAIGPEHLQGLADSTAAITRTRRQAVLSDPSAVPVKIGGSGKLKRTLSPPVTAGHEQPAGLTARKKAIRSGTVTGSDGGPSVRMGRYRLQEALRLQGLPPDFLDHCPFTAEGKLKAIANGVCVHTGRALAKAIREAIQEV